MINRIDWLRNHSIPAGRRFINPLPDGFDGVFINIVPHTDLPVAENAANLLEKGAIDSGVDSLNVNSTTTGKHSSASFHFYAQAFDINKVNGIRVVEQGASPGVQALQSSFQNQATIAENFGPSANTRVRRDGKLVQKPKQASAHQNHLHVSSY